MTHVEKIDIDIFKVVNRAIAHSDDLEIMAHSFLCTLMRRWAWVSRPRKRQRTQRGRTSLIQARGSPGTRTQANILRDLPDDGAGRKERFQSDQTAKSVCVQ